MPQLKTKTLLTLEEFLAMPSTDVTYELVEGVAVPKMSPKRFHARVTGALYTLLDQWCQEKGEVNPEWAIVLQRHGQDWVPVPDLIYISVQRLPSEVIEDEACPVPPELAIEIISPGQTFGQLAEKATDYLEAGVLRVWVVDPQARSITVFYPDAPPRTYTKAALITDSLFEGLELTPQQVFGKARLPQKG
ncbi:MAG: Uma2 family endonuclease [Moorea sp. SIOASIH]|uniref:Uma2 family endonuclease n=1 Tax=Moorena sp. SIOASIH TaxID=2607817 RepID=UPI0013B7338F|nr:Uma2 family endonuclease [Moorena sp. SIOASIH]NEO37175.1 Uma2 family endonuclease [Moorena sp. SIOASIH]